MADYRPIPDADEAAYRMAVNYGFRLADGPFGPEDDEWLYPELGERRGVYDDGDLCCVCRHYFWDVRVRGKWHPTGALTVVATPPEFRRQGYATTLLEGTLLEYHDRGAYLALLWPFSYDLYRAYGWGMANRYATFDGPPDAFGFAATDPRGRFRRVRFDEYRALEPVYDIHSSRTELALSRPREWWRDRVFRLHETPQYVYAWERGGEVRGYLVYVVETDGDRQVLHVRELVYLDHEALLSCLRFLYYHETQVDLVRIYGPPGMPLQELVAEPDDLTVTLHAGPMLRLVDVSSALAARSYPDTATGSLVLNVTDRHAGWNHGRIALEVRDGSATCEPTDGPADASCDVATLSQCYVGARSISDAIEMGNLTVESREICETMSALFPEETVFFREDF